MLVLIFVTDGFQKMQKWLTNRLFQLQCSKRVELLQSHIIRNRYYDCEWARKCVFAQVPKIFSSVYNVCLLHLRRERHHSQLHCL